VRPANAAETWRSGTTNEWGWQESDPAGWKRATVKGTEASGRTALFMAVAVFAGSSDPGRFGTPHALFGVRRGNRT